MPGRNRIIFATTHEREYHSKEDILSTARQRFGSFLTDNTVEFKAYFLDAFGNHHHELLLLSLRMGAGFMDGTFY
jgi:hypothetical protein